MIASQQFNLATLFPFLAILTPLALFWGQVKTLLSKLLNVFIISTEFEDSAAHAINYNINANYKKYSMGSYHYSAHNLYVNKINRKIEVAVEMLSRLPQLIRVNKSLFLLKNNVHKDNLIILVNKISLYYIRGTFNHESFLLESMNRYNDSLTSKENKNRFFIQYRKGMGKKTIITHVDDKAPSAQIGSNPYGANSDENLEIMVSRTNRLIGFNLEDIGLPNTNGELKSYVFCDQAERLLAECKRWKESEEWYRSRGILWRRGALLIGCPGSGKTSLIRNICKILDLPLFIFDLASMSNSEMIDCWENIQSNSPCAVLFDDIEKVFDNGVNIIGENGGGLSYDCFLSCLSGAKPAEGILTFCTTNDSSKLNDTLGISQNGIASRPGRIDTIIEINQMEEVNRRKLAQLILSDLDVDIEAIVTESANMTAAQVGEKCTKIALQKYWEAKTT